MDGTDVHNVMNGDRARERYIRTGLPTGKKGGGK
jgi:hypothetical protein